MSALEKMEEEALKRWKKERNASFGFLMEYWRFTGRSANAQATLAALYSYTDGKKRVVFPSYRDMETVRPLADSSHGGAASTGRRCVESREGS